MGRQTFRDESNYKHEPHAKHYVDDEFEKGTSTRNWKKNVNTEEEEQEDLKGSESDEESFDAPKNKPVITNSPLNKSIK